MKGALKPPKQADPKDAYPKECSPKDAYPVGEAYPVGAKED